MENSWANALADGKTVDVDIAPHYTGDSMRPSSFNVNYAIDGDRYSQSFENVAGQTFNR